VSGYDNTLEIFLHNILWTDEACCMCEGMFSIQNSHLWAQDHPHTICGNGYQINLTIIFWVGNIGDSSMGHYLLSDILLSWKCWPGRLFEHQGPVAWLPHLLDVTDRFFNVGHLKEHIFSLPPRSAEDLAARLQATMGS
jgi:hypothetical protein